MRVGLGIDPRRAHLRSLGLTDAAIADSVNQMDIRALTAVLQGMRVPWPWCATSLVLAYFPLLLHNDEHPDDPRMMKVTVGIKGLPKGQAPPHDAAEIRRDVDWWYRLNVKEPKDEHHQLTAEDAERENRVTAAHSVVSRGLIRAALLLQAEITDPAGLVA